jgi:hypothetical protein
MSANLPESPRNWERKVDDFIAQSVASHVNNDLLKACEKLLDHAMNETWPPMYVLANARDAIDGAKRAKGIRP